MARSRSSRKRSSRRLVYRTLRVPTWYYVLLGVIALIGVTLIWRSLQIQPPDPEQGEHPLGRAEAPVTIIEWGGFQ